VTITNNIIVNNMAGWDGAGISLQDALNVNIINNTIMHNDTLASSGVLTNSIGTPQASAPPGNCTMPGPTGADTASCPQSAGVTSTPNSSLLTTTFVVPITCPTGHSGCTGFSNPILYGDVISQNRSFYIGVGNRGAGNLNQQNLVSLYDAFTTTLAPTQGSTGACSTGVTYWDLGVRGDRTLTGHESGFTLTPVSSFVTAGYTGNNNSNSAPGVIRQYCNGSRVPPECTVADGCGGLNGFGVPPGIADAIAGNPLFSLVPSATVDEGNNWINVSWGPLSMVNPSNPSTGAPPNNYGGGLPLGNYSITSSSAASNFITCTNANAIGQGCQVNPVPGNTTYTITLPTTDFFGQRRPDPGTPGQPKRVDAGAVEVQVAGAGTAAPLVTGIVPNEGWAGTSVPVTISGFALTGGTVTAPGSANITITNVVAVDANTITATLNLGPTTIAGAHNIAVTTAAGSSTVGFTVLRPTLTSISPSSGTHGTSVPVTLTGTNLVTATSVNAPGSPGITVTNFVVVNDSTVTATLNLATATTPGNHNITVTTAGGALSNPVVFTVN
jgi:hypothetical protein